MKVSKTDHQQPITRVATDRASSAGERKAPAPARAADPVRLSDAGRRLAAARSPEAPDEARIERLRALVADGKLTIDASAIADAILREER